MPRLRVFTNPSFPKGRSFAFGVRQMREMLEAIWHWLTWQSVFPSPDRPMPPLAGQAALRQAARLSESVDAVSQRRLRR